VPTLVVPERYNKNAADVRAEASQAETGTGLIEYMCQRLGVPDLGQLNVLDFGCGCRFADAIVNNRLPIGSYTGIDVDREMIDFLTASVADPRFAFHHWNARNPLYNPAGFPLTRETRLPSERAFDVVCMFSVITHQLPEDAEALFHVFRRYIRPRGRMFFSVRIDDMPDDYRELEPQAAGHSAYSWRFLRQLLERSGWRVLSMAGKAPPAADGRKVPIQDSVLCAPASGIGRLLRKLR
jgi:SAM-dependent methyltransferase